MSGEGDLPGERTRPRVRRLTPRQPRPRAPPRVDPAWTGTRDFGISPANRCYRFPNLRAVAVPPQRGRARHSVRAAPATSGRKISLASPSQPAADQDLSRGSRINFGTNPDSCSQRSIPAKRGNPDYISAPDPVNSPPLKPPTFNLKPSAKVAPGSSG